MRRIRKTRGRAGARSGRPAFRDPAQISRCHRARGNVCRGADDRGAVALRGRGRAGQNQLQDPQRAHRTPSLRGAAQSSKARRRSARKVDRRLAAQAGAGGAAARRGAQKGREVVHRLRGKIHRAADRAGSVDAADSCRGRRLSLIPADASHREGRAGDSSKTRRSRAAAREARGQGERPSRATHGISPIPAPAHFRRAALVGNDRDRFCDRRADRVSARDGAAVVHDRRSRGRGAVRRDARPASDRKGPRGARGKGARHRRRAARR